MPKPPLPPKEKASGIAEAALSAAGADAPPEKREVISGILPKSIGICVKSKLPKEGICGAAASIDGVSPADSLFMKSLMI